MAGSRVLLTDIAWPDDTVEREVLAAVGAELTLSPAADEATLAALAMDVDAIMTTWARVTSRVIDAAPRLRIVARLGIGLDNIDVQHATRRRVLVTNVPDYCQVEVAEHTLALILALGRNVGLYHLATKQGRYERDIEPPLRRLAGQTLGLVGCGGIGQAVAVRALALGMNVLAWTRGKRPLPAGCRRAELDELLATSDYVSLHVPATPELHRLLDERRLARVKRGAFLVNTSRGALVDEAALADAIERGHIAGAALDVQDREPPDLEGALFRDARVIVTPHAAFASRESVAELRRRAALQVADVLCGRVPPNVVNPQAQPAK